MGLNVCVVGAEEILRTVDCELLDLVDDLAAAVVAPAGVPLRVLVRRHAAHRLEHARPGEVLGGNQLDLTALPLELALDEGRGVGIDLGQPGPLELLERLLRDGHGSTIPPKAEGEARLLRGGCACDRGHRVGRGNGPFAEDLRLRAR
jgi:hypothetical protein